MKSSEIKVLKSKYKIMECTDNINENPNYIQAPYIPITEKEYEKLISKIKPLKLKEDVHELTEKYCDGESCLI